MEGFREFVCDGGHRAWVEINIFALAGFRRFVRPLFIRGAWRLLLRGPIDEPLFAAVGIKKFFETYPVTGAGFAVKRSYGDPYFSLVRADRVEGHAGHRRRVFQNRSAGI